ncbi:MAG TPA: HD domain-containing protein [Frankiaceae bacterium]|nr:HD domain-containing protein [Frankiaceae bacterium]
MTRTRMLAEPGEHMAEDGSAARHRLQHLSTRVAATNLALWQGRAGARASTVSEPDAPSLRPDAAEPPNKEAFMTIPSPRVGSVDWSDRTQGRLTAAETRQLLPALARTHVVNAFGRTAMLLHLHSGRRAHLPERALRMPSSVLTKTAEQVAHERLTPALLNHSYRCYSFGVALAALEDVDVDRELLFAAAMLHDTGLSRPIAGIDFTVASARIALDVAETVGLPSAATETMRSAITLHHSPDVSRADGAVAYLLSAGAGMDVVGLRSWKVPGDVLASVLRDRPRLGFKDEFRSMWSAQVAAVPRGRARLLRRYGAFDLAIRMAPFDE